MSSADFQAILLNFFGQELVAHAATVFAALSGAFFFMRSFRPEPWKIKRLIAFSFISTLLITIVVYAGFRMVVYGQFSSLAMSYNPPDQVPTELSQFASPPNSGNWTLTAYYYYIVNLSEISLRERPCWNKWFFQLAAGFRYPTNNPQASKTIFVVGVISFCSIFFSAVSLGRVSYLLKQANDHVTRRIRRRDRDQEGKVG